MATTVAQLGKPQRVHTETGFLLHETFSVEEIKQCNGMLVEIGTQWIWFAGDAMISYLSSLGTNLTLSDVATLTSKLLLASNPGIHVRDMGGSRKARYEFVALQGTTFAGRTGTPRIYAIVTNVFSGFGASDGFYDTGIAVTDQVYGTADRHTFAKAAALKSDVTAGYTENGVVGCAVIAIPRVVWERFVDDVFARYEHADQSEVQKKLAAARPLALAALRKFDARGLYVYVPVQLRRNDVPHVVRPFPENDVVKAVGNIDVQYNIMPDFGSALNYLFAPRSTAISANSTPVTQVKLPHAVPNRTNTRGSDVNSFAFIGYSESFAAGQLAVNDAPTIPCTKIDGVPIQNILGSLAYPLFRKIQPVVGSAETEWSTKRFLQYYIGAIVPGGTDAIPAQGQMTAGQYETAVGALGNSAAEPLGKTRFATWDSYAFSAGPALAIIAGSLHANSYTKASIQNACYWLLDGISTAPPALAAGVNVATRVSATPLYG